MKSIMAAFSNPTQWFVDWIKGQSWESERHERATTSEQAMSYAPVWYGVNKICGHVAQLPIGVYRRLDRGAERDRNHTIHKIFRRPNPYQSSIVFREQVSLHSLLDGNGRAAIVRSGTRIVELIPLLPECTSTGMLAGEKLHATRPSADDRLRRYFPSVNPDDPTGVIMLDDKDVLHIPGLSSNGITGIALRDIAGRNLRAAINAEKRLSKQMEQGFAGNLMLQAPPGVFRSQQDAEEFLDAFEKRHHDPEKAGKAGLLREGITANLIAQSNSDAEMIENRKFQRQDAALYLGLESILGDDSSVSYNSLEQKNLAYLMNTLNKWLGRWEQEIEYKLLPIRQYASESHYVRFNTAALLKSDYKTSVESLATAIQSTILSPNEAREKLDLNPYDGGDEHLNPAINTRDAQTAPEPRENEPEPNEEQLEPEETQASLAARARIAHLIGVEAAKVAKAAKKAQDGGKNFVAWLDDFYDSNWLPKLADAMEEIGLDRQLAEDHCVESKSRLLEALHCEPENLANEISATVSGWKSRANTIGISDV